MRYNSSADFDYKMGVFEGKNVLLILDRNLGNRSVTNDIENVVDDIATYEGIVPEEFLILYRDSDSNWDGWDASTRRFFHLANVRQTAILRQLIY